MKRFFKIFILMAFLASPLVVLPQSKVEAEKGSPIEIVVNGETIEVSSVPANGRVEIYSIIGAKVASLTIKDGIATDQLTLSKGYYILKAANSTKKIAVK